MTNIHICICVWTYPCIHECVYRYLYFNFFFFCLSCFQLKPPVLSGGVYNTQGMWDGTVLTVRQTTSNLKEKRKSLFELQSVPCRLGSCTLTGINHWYLATLLLWDQAKIFGRHFKVNALIKWRQLKRKMPRLKQVNTLLWKSVFLMEYLIKWITVIL